MNWSFLNILMLFGSLQGFLIVLILFLKKEENKKARFYLAAILFGLSMNLLYYFFYVVGLTSIFPVLKLIYLPWCMFSAISFYLYIAFTAPFQKKITFLNKLGFAPFIIFSILLVTVKFYNFFSESTTRIPSSFVSLLFIVEEYFGIVYSLFLGYLSYKKINKIEVQLQQQFSNYNKSKLVFHKRLILVVFVFCVIWAAAITYAQVNHLESMSIYFSIWLFMTFVIHWIAWTGFIKDEALLPVFNNNSIKNRANTEVILQSNSVVKLDKNNKNYTFLISLLEKEKLYLDADLSLDILSGKLGISKSYLSALINQTTNKNFYHFVNSYRIEHLISLFKNQKDKEFTILSLAFESGFNSKSTFQSFFKKNTGKTPTQYIKELERNKINV